MFIERNSAAVAATAAATDDGDGICYGRDSSEMVIGWWSVVDGF